VYETHLLRRTFREGGKVKHETLGNISHLPPEVIEMIRLALKGEAFLPASSSLKITRSLPHGHVACVLGTMRKLGLENILASRPSRERDLVAAMVAGRILEPSSKLACARALDPETATSTLAEALGVSGATEDELYRAMDWLCARQARIEVKLAKRHLEQGSLILYDVSSSYYTGSSCPLADFGHSRDGKRGFPQINYGLLCNREGIPVAVEVFRGNTGDPSTLGSAIEKIRSRFGLASVVLVGDRGLITSARITEELAGIEGLAWITALKAPAIRALAEEGVIQPSLFDTTDLAEISSPDYPGERLIACHNPLLASERARTRQELLAATEAELDKIVAATRRDKRPLRGKDKIALRVGRAIDRFKVAKHFKLNIGEESFSYQRDEERIAEEAALDGIYVIRTSVPAQESSPEEAVRAYKDLARVEQAFRCLKTVDLKARPIGHRRPDRVRAHVFICMLAYYLEWHMRRCLAPILFEEEERELACALRESVVAPAQRTPAAKRKAAGKRTEDGLPVHSFQTLLADLRTIAKNRVNPVGQYAEGAFAFDLITQPTPLQRKALDLLGVSLTL
jgi:transposase